MKKIIILFFCAALAACNNNQDDLHDHDHEDVKLYFTSYNEVLEVFAEADPFTKGKTSAILAHLTHLKDFKPIKEGKVTLSMVIGEQGIRQTLENAGHPGIYHFNLQPQQSGSGRIFFDIEYKGESFRVDGGNIYVYEDDHAALHSADQQKHEHPGAVTFTKEQSWQINFASTAVEKEPVGEIIKTLGEVLPAQGDEIILTSKIQGRVDFTGGHLYEGTPVKKSRGLVNIVSEGLPQGISESYQQAENNLRKAHSDFERLKSLYESRIVSESQLLEAENEYKNAKAVFDNLSKDLSSSGQVIKSSIDGFITEIMVEQGEFVEAGQPLIKVAGNQNVIIKAEVQQRYSSLLKDLKGANIRAKEENYTLEDLNGRYISYSRNVNAGSHLLPVYLEIENKPSWVTGTLLDLYLETSDQQPSLVVPNSALLEEQDNYFVFVQINPEQYEKRQIKTGKTDGKKTEIISGLSEGERVVSMGANLVKMAASSGNLDPHSGHVH